MENCNLFYYESMDIEQLKKEYKTTQNQFIKKVIKKIYQKKKQLYTNSLDFLIKQETNETNNQISYLDKKFEKEINQDYHNNKLRERLLCETEFMNKQKTIEEPFFNDSHKQYLGDEYLGDYASIDNMVIQNPGIRKSFN